MVSPLVLVHPAEQDVEQVDEQVLLDWEALSVVLEVSYDLIGNVDDVDRFVGLPIILDLVLLFHKKLDVVHEAKEDLLLLRAASHDLQKTTGHVLATLTTLAELELSIVLDLSVHDCFLEFLYAVVVGNGLVFFVVLAVGRSTLAGSRGLPLALSVLGLMRVPGGFP